jgi:hypothetical protein
LLITTGNSENPCPPTIALPDDLFPRGAVGERFERANTHPQNARTLVHDWRAKSGNSENCCPRCHKNTRPLPPRVHWYWLKCFPLPGWFSNRGNLNAAQATKGEMARILRPPETSMVAVSFVHHRQRTIPRNHFYACQSSSGGIGPSRHQSSQESSRR